ncbi:MAG: hypothetical protein M3380_03975 [Chloroflexota bacterium]|nr:hypothetical protein [Chloroflexota bacterium]
MLPPRPPRWMALWALQGTQGVSVEQDRNVRGMVGPTPQPAESEQQRPCVREQQADQGGRQRRERAERRKRKRQGTR